MTISLETVESAARQVIETSGGAPILGVEPVSLASGDQPVAELIATLSLLGSLGGTLVVLCTWPHAVALASGMLGGAEPDKEMVHDALGEVVNQIGGSIKRSLGVGDSEILLSPPVVVSGSPLSHCVRSSKQPLSMEVRAESAQYIVALWPS